MMIRECTHSIDKMDYRWCHHCCCGAEQWTNAQDIDQLRQPTDRRKSNLGSQQCQRTHPSNGIDTIHSVSIYTSILYIDHFRIGRIRILLDVRIVWYHRVLYCTMLIKGAKKKTASDDIQHLIMSLMLAIKMCSMPIVYLYIGIWQYHVLSAYQQHQINVHVLADSFTCLYAAVSYTRSYVLLCGYHVADWYVSIAWIMRCDRQNPMLHQLLDLSFNNRVQYVLIQKCRQKNQEDLSSILLLLCISHN